jgi:hypothetical protein
MIIAGIASTVNVQLILLLGRLRWAVTDLMGDGRYTYKAEVVETLQAY